MKIASISYILLLLFVVPSTCFAVEVTAVVDVGFGGVCRHSVWNPVNVTLSGADKDIDGAAVVSVTRGQKQVKYCVPVNLPRSSVKRFTMYVQPSNYADEMTVAILDGQRSVKTVKRKYRCLDTEYLMVTAGKKQSALNFLTGINIGAADAPGAASSPGTAGDPRTVQVGRLDLNGLPDKPGGYAAVDMLVLTDFEASRADIAALDAIKMWIAGGGSVTVCGGADWARLRSPFFKDILPVDVQNSVEVSGLDSLARSYGSELPAGASYVCQSLPKPGASVLLRQRDIPLIVQRRYGLGKVIFLAFDPLVFPLKGWDGQTDLWKKLIFFSGASPSMFAVSAAAPYSPVGQSHAKPWVTEYQHVLEMESAQPPSPGIIAGFLLIYLFVLVPANYFYLDRKNKRELAWLTTPVIVLVFAIGSWGLGYAIRGGDTVLNRIRLVEASDNTMAASVTGYLGLFAANRGNHDFSIEDRFALAEEASNAYVERHEPNPADVFQGDSAEFRNLKMEQWSGRLFRMESGLVMKGPLATDLRLSGTRLQGKVTNRTGLDLTGCMVLWGNRQQVIGRLRPGDSKEISLDLSSPPIRQPTANNNMRDKIFSKAFVKAGESNSPVLIGWLRDSELPVQSKGRKLDGEDVSMVVFHIAHRSSSVGAASGQASELDQTSPNSLSWRADTTATFDSRLTLVRNDDGETTITMVDGVLCRMPLNSSSHCFYFRIDDSFIHDSDLTTYLQVTYHEDERAVTVRPEYDSKYPTDESGTDGRYKKAAPPIKSVRTGKWKTVTWKLDRCKFANRQNAGADFRLYVGPDGAEIRSVTLTTQASDLDTGTQGTL